MYPSVACDPNSEIAQVVKKAGEEVTGIEPVVTGTRGASDYAWYVAGANDIPDS